jgi:starvation-inducible DNA-binding protein
MANTTLARALAPAATPPKPRKAAVSASSRKIAEWIIIGGSGRTWFRISARVERHGRKAGCGGDRCETVGPTPRSGPDNEQEITMAKKGDNRRAGEVTDGLRRILADTYRLFGKTQASHWNVIGPSFAGLHALFETQYREMFEAIDELAERLRALGVAAPSSITELLGESRLGETAGNGEGQGTKLAGMLAADHRRLADLLRDLAATADDAEDPATHDLLVQRSAVHEKAAWMLRSAAA